MYRYIAPKSQQTNLPDRLRNQTLLRLRIVSTSSTFGHVDECIKPTTIPTVSLLGPGHEYESLSCSGYRTRTICAEKKNDMRPANCRICANTYVLLTYLLTYILTYLHTYLLSYLLTYLLTPWCKVLLEKLIGLQLVKKFTAFHGTRRFITALTSVRHLSLSWASPIQSIYPHPTS